MEINITDRAFFFGVQFKPGSGLSFNGGAELALFLILDNALESEVMNASEKIEISVRDGIFILSSTQTKGNVHYILNMSPVNLSALKLMSFLSKNIVFVCGESNIKKDLNVGVFASGTPSEMVWIDTQEATAVIPTGDIDTLNMTPETAGQASKMLEFYKRFEAGH